MSFFPKQVKNRSRMKTEASAPSLDVFMINNRELDIIKTTDQSSRYFLLKQGNDGVVARVDLSGMEDVISILSGRASTVRILDDVIRKYGDDPSVWIQKFHQAVENL